MNVAVVDDHEAVCTTFAELLRLQNHVVECFYSAETLLDCPRLRDFGCLLVDFGLPGKNGVELMRCLREKSIMTPAILISGNMDDKLNEAIANLDHIVTLRKPCAAGAILETVKSFETFFEREKCND